MPFMGLNISYQFVYYIKWKITIYKESTNLIYQQDNVQTLQNVTPSYHQMYRPVIPNNTVVHNWKNEPIVPENGWEQQM